MDAYQSHDMVQRNKILATLEQWSSLVFLAAGGLFAFPPIAAGVRAVTGTEITVTPAIIFIFLGVVFIGLLGLYPEIAERDARLAYSSAGLLAATTAILLPAVGFFLVPTGFPFSEATALAIVVTVAVGSSLTVTSFGIASLRTGAHSRSVGAFLLVMAAGLSLMIVVMLVFGHATPDGVSVLVNGLVALSLGSIGSVLRSANIPSAHSNSAGDLTAS